LLHGVIRNTKSVCTTCIKKIDAEIVEENEKVYMLKECEEHGKFKILLSNYPKQYKELSKNISGDNQN